MVGCKVCLGVFGGVKQLARTGRINGNYARRTLTAASVVLLVFGLLVSLLGAALLTRATADTDDQRVYVGIDVAYDDEDAVYRLVNEVKGYVNLIILGSLNVTTDTAKLTRVCDYLYQQGLYFIVYVGFGEGTYLPPRGPAQNFFNEGKARWGDKLLGAYVFDEAGGKTLDLMPDQPYKNYTDAAEQFVYHTHYFLANYSYYYGSPNLKLVTSDYALYWYDYVLGYDVVFGEFVGNQSRQLAVALDRGAAKAMGKDWGTMITLKYTQPPYVEPPLELLHDMVTAYRNGAKYIIVFNGPGTNHTATTRYGILTQAHLAAMQLFWTYTQLTPTPEEFPTETAYVLPKDYGYGFRGPADRIWGYFPPDNLSPVVWNASNSLIQKYGIKLDIVYETKFNNIPVNLPYERLIYWNGTIIEKSGPD
jgi:hypothetical protein